MIDELQHAEKLSAEIETARKAHALAITSEQRKRVQARAMERLGSMKPETEAVTNDVGDQIIALLDGGYSPTGCEVTTSTESSDAHGDAGDRVLAQLEQSRPSVGR